MCATISMRCCRWVHAGGGRGLGKGEGGEHATSGLGQLATAPCCCCLTLRSAQPCQPPASPLPTPGAAAGHPRAPCAPPAACQPAGGCARPGAPPRGALLGRSRRPVPARGRGGQGAGGEAGGVGGLGGVQGGPRCRRCTSAQRAGALHRSAPPATACTVLPPLRAISIDCRLIDCRRSPRRTLRTPRRRWGTLAATTARAWRARCTASQVRAAARLFCATCVCSGAAALGHDAPHREVGIAADQLHCLACRTSSCSPASPPCLPLLLPCAAIRNRKGSIVGLTCRVGRAVTGHIDMIRDILDGG